MGNYMSACTFQFTPKLKSNKTVRVIFPTGEIRQFQNPVKAAEIMIDCPNYFLVNSRSLIINRRFSPLSADQDLEFGNVYIIFPMRRANLMVTPADMAGCWMSANNAPKRISGRISPESEVEQPRLVVDVPEFGHRFVVCRSKKPILDTIKEETGRAR